MLALLACGAHRHGCRARALLGGQHGRQRAQLGAQALEQQQLLLARQSLQRRICRHTPGIDSAQHLHQGGIGSLIRQATSSFCSRDSTTSGASATTWRTPLRIFCGKALYQGRKLVKRSHWEQQRLLLRRAPPVANVPPTPWHRFHSDLHTRKTRNTVRQAAAAFCLRHESSYCRGSSYAHPWCSLFAPPPRVQQRLSRGSAWLSLRIFSSVAHGRTKVRLVSGDRADRAVSPPSS